MFRRLDEVICSKADRTSMKEFRQYVDESFLSKDENKIYAR